MSYDVKYDSMTAALEKTNNAIKSLDGYVTRLNGVKSTLGFCTSLQGHQTAVASRASAAGQIRTMAASAWMSLNEARVEYYMNEQLVYQLLSGDYSFSIGEGLLQVSELPSIIYGALPKFKDIWNYLNPGKSLTGAYSPEMPWPIIPWWMFVLIKTYLMKNPEVGAAVAGAATLSATAKAEASALKSGSASVLASKKGTAPYSGSLNYSNYSVVGGFSEAYFYKQGDYGRFVNSSGRNVGCTATAEAIVVSMAKGTKVSPNDVGWATGGATWQHSHVIPGSNNMSSAQKLNLLASQLAGGNPVVVRANANHTVAAVGLKNGANMSNISASDILIVDPYTGKLTTLDKAASGGCSLPTGWSLMVAN